MIKSRSSSLDCYFLQGLSLLAPTYARAPVVAPDHPSLEPPGCQSKISLSVFIFIFLVRIVHHPKPCLALLPTQSCGRIPVKIPITSMRGTPSTHHFCPLLAAFTHRFSICHPYLGEDRCSYARTFQSKFFLRL